MNRHACIAFLTKFKYQNYDMTYMHSVCIFTQLKRVHNALSQQQDKMKQQIKLHSFFGNSRLFSQRMNSQLEQ